MYPPYDSQFENMVKDSSSSSKIVADYVDEDYGEQVRTDNIAASTAIADLIRTTLGPNGRDKLLVHESYDVTGESVVTNDGTAILDELDVQHPAANVLVELSLQQKERGGGATTAVILAGELLSEASTLLEMGLHPSTIIQGYTKGIEIVMENLSEVAIDGVEPRDHRTDIVKTAVAGTLGGENEEKIPQLITDALRSVQDDDGIDAEDIKIVPRVGGSMADSEIVNGVMLDKQRVDESMPESVTDPSIAVLGTSIQIDEFERVPKNNKLEQFNLKGAEIHRSIIDQEEEQVKSMASKFAEVGADVVFVNGFIDDRAIQILSKHGILAVRHVDSEDLRRIAKVTGADLVGKLEELTSDNLGQAGIVSHDHIGGDNLIKIDDGNNPGCVTILLRAGTELVMDELERTVKSGIAAGQSAFQDTQVLPGAGATETALATIVREAAPGIEDRKQLAVKAFADALEIVPRTLARNAGHDPIDTLVELRTAHADGRHTIGVGSDESPIIDAAAEGIFEPFNAKKQMMKNTVEVTTTLLRVDGLIATEPLSSEEEDEVVERVEKGEDKETAIEKVVNER